MGRLRSEKEGSQVTVKVIGSGVRFLESVVSVLGGLRVAELGVPEVERELVRPPRVRLCHGGRKMREQRLYL